jgi:HEAT repeat protein
MSTTSRNLDAELVAMRSRPIREVIAILNDTSQPTYRRIAAVSTLRYSSLTEEEKLTTLIAVLSDNDQDFVSWIIEELGDLKDKRALEKIKLVVRKFSSAEIQAKALLALARLGDSLIIKDCIAFLYHGGKAEACLAAQALLELNAPAAISGLRTFVETCREPEKKLAVALQLARSGDRLAEPFLCETLGANQTSDVVRLMVASVLSRFKNPQGLSALQESLSSWREEELFVVANIVSAYAGLVLEPNLGVREQILRWVAQAVT